WLQPSWPAACMRATIGSLPGFSAQPSTKKLAGADASSSTSSSAGVNRSSGPSSKVSATTRSRVLTAVTIISLGAPPSRRAKGDSSSQHPADSDPEASRVEAYRLPEVHDPRECSSVVGAANEAVVRGGEPAAEDLLLLARQRKPLKQVGIEVHGAVQVRRMLRHELPRQRVARLRGPRARDSRNSTQRPIEPDLEDQVRVAATRQFRIRSPRCQIRTALKGSGRDHDRLDRSKKPFLVVLPKLPSAIGTELRIRPERAAAVAILNTAIGEVDACSPIGCRYGVGESREMLGLPKVVR